MSACWCWYLVFAVRVALFCCVCGALFGPMSPVCRCRQSCSQQSQQLVLRPLSLAYAVQYNTTCHTHGRSGHFGGYPLLFLLGTSDFWSKYPAACLKCVQDRSQAFLHPYVTPRAMYLLPLSSRRLDRSINLDTTKPPSTLHSTGSRRGRAGRDTIPESLARPTRMS